jgi:hypothetical protein
VLAENIGLTIEEVLVRLGLQDELEDVAKTQDA